MHLIDEMRAPQYAKYGQQVNDPPGMQWFVCADANTDTVLACAALGPSQEGPNGRVLFDLLGNDLQALNVLALGLIRLARKNGWGLTTMMPVDAPSRIQYAVQRGFVATGIVLHLSATAEQEEVG